MAFLTLSSCSPQEDLPFPWAYEGKEFNYDYFSSTDTVKDALTVSLVKTNSPLKFYYYYNQWETIYEYQSVTDDHTIYSEEDGLHSSARPDCYAFFGILDETFQYLRIPAKPIVGEEYYLYLCKDEVISTYTITAVDTHITVPFGSVKTFVMQEAEDDTIAINRYWSEKHGLIKIEKGNFGKGEIIYYELTHSN
jgi:hypothetical protein